MGKVSYKFKREKEQKAAHRGLLCFAYCPGSAAAKSKNLHCFRCRPTKNKQQEEQATSVPLNIDLR